MSSRPPEVVLPDLSEGRSPLRIVLAFIAAIAVVLVPTYATPTSARADGSAVTIDDVSFRNDSFPDGSRQTLDVKWTIPSTATNPVILTLDLPEGLQGYSDKFDMIGPDGEVAGTCTVSAAQVVCTVDPAFIDENPEDVSGSSESRV